MHTSQMVVDAEKFKAAVEPPKGNLATSDQNHLSTLIKKLLDSDDDEFFHLTCHIESNLKQKIEHGEFVDLE